LRYLSLQRLNPAQVIARATYRRINDSVVDFFRDLGGVENLPKDFDVNGEGWVEAETRIDAVAQAGEIDKTIQLCREYECRALVYFGAWRKKLEKRKEAGDVN